MSEPVIREVEWAPEGEGVEVTIEDWVESLEVPPPCAACLAVTTTRYPVRGLNWLEIPYCEECVPRRSEDSSRKNNRMTAILVVAAVLGVLVSWWFLLLALLLLADLRGGPRGDAVKLLLSSSGTYRLEFRNEEYAQYFVEANGATMPEE